MLPSVAKRENHDKHQALEGEKRTGHEADHKAQTHPILGDQKGKTSGEEHAENLPCLKNCVH